MFVWSFNVKKKHFPKQQPSSLWVRTESFECAKLRVSHIFVPYVPHVPYVLTCLTCLRSFVSLFLTCLHFFTCLHFIYVLLIKLTQINELTYDSSSLLLLKSVIYKRLASIFTFIKLVSYSLWFSLFLKRKVLITSNAKGNTWPLFKTGTLFETRNSANVKIFYNKA